MKKMVNQMVIASLILLFSAACSKKQVKIPDSQKEEKISLSGNYVTGSYFHRNEGYDWIAVKVNQLTDTLLKISIRSRADIKKPTCTFDAMAVKQDSTGKYKALKDGNSVLFRFAADSLLITGDQGNSGLKNFCSGDGTIYGIYKKINGPLDSAQVDKVRFRKTLNFKDYNFVIVVYNNTMTIELTGPDKDIKTETNEINGTVMNAEVEDLNADGYPEVLVYIQSAGSGSYGSVIGYSVNNGKSMSPVFLPEIAENKEASDGYMGHDEFSIIENTLVRRYPVYKPGDINARPTGGMRQIQYKLIDSQDSREFVVDKIAGY